MLAFPAPYYCLISILITTQSQPDYSHHAATVRQVGGGETALLCAHLLYMQITSLSPLSLCVCFLHCTGLLLCQQLCLSRGICLGLPL